jgi:hypothetical protein
VTIGPTMIGADDQQSAAVRVEPLESVLRRPVLGPSRRD